MISGDLVSHLTQTFAPPAAVAAVFFIFAWLRTRKKRIFSDAHGSRWDVAGLALGCLIGAAIVHDSLRRFPPNAGIDWLPYALACVLVYLAAAAMFRFPEGADSAAICVVFAGAFLLILLRFPFFFKTDEGETAQWLWIIAFLAVALLCGTAFAFLAWRFEAKDFFLVSVPGAAPLSWFALSSLSSESMGRTLLLPACVGAAGLVFTLIRRHLRLTTAFGLLWGHLSAVILAYAWLATYRPPSPWLLALLFGGLVAPAVLAAIPAIAENRLVARLVLPASAVALPVIAILAARG